MTGHGGTARSRAIGGAIVSLGGDISTASVNPAGLAQFRTNEFVISPSLGFNNSNLKYLDNDKKSNKLFADIANVGVIFTKPGSRNGQWRNFTFAIGLNRSTNFGNNISLSGTNKQSSYSEKYLEDLINNIVTDPNKAATDFPYGASLAFNTYLIDTISGPGNIINGYRSLATPQTGVLQDMNVKSNGNMQEFYVSGSANLQEKLFLGASIVFNRISYERTTTFRESDITKLKNNFNYFETEEFLQSEGIGVGLKLGAIYKPSSQLRLGLAFHSPMMYSMDDRYSTRITTELEGYLGNGKLTQSSTDFNGGDLGQFQYNYTNPMRLMVGASYLFNAVEDVKKQKGFISADIEYINHASSKFKTFNSNSEGTGYLSEVNAAMQNQFKSAINFRVGGEIKFNTMMARLGFNFLGNPYGVSDLVSNRMNISTGLGYRNKGYFIDITYVHQLMKDIIFPYRLDNGFFEQGFMKGSNGMLLATVGFKF
jgi:long-subunit fatty acid transport protein